MTSPKTAGKAAGKKATRVSLPSTMRSAFLGADIKSASEGLVLRLVRHLKQGAGVINRRQMWNKTFSDGPRPKGLGRSR